jgi:uncharacterized delta-60 repeat protein
MSLLKIRNNTPRRLTDRAVRPLVLACFVIVTSATVALAQPGVLDPSFGGDGVVLTDITKRSDFAIDVALGSDGKIVAAGVSGLERADPNITVIRYGTDGALDTTFSSDGKVTTDFHALRDAANDVVVQPDGKIVASGLAQTANSHANFALVRYDDGGSLDAAFGGDGRVETSFTKKSDSIQGVVLLDDGDIIAAGIAGYLGPNPRMALARYNADGTLDGSFGGDGKVMTDLVPGWEAAYGIALQPDAKVVVAGVAGAPNGKLALARYGLDGSLDATFGGDGTVTTNFTKKYDEALGVTLQGDGKIVAVGGAGWGGQNPQFAAARYLDDGSLDATFGGDGKVRTDFTAFGDYANDVRIQSDGRIVVVGEARAERTDSTIALARYNTDGSLDGSFGSSGRVRTNISSTSDNAIGIELQTDGRIVVGGSADYGGNGKYVVARYEAI